MFLLLSDLEQMGQSVLAEFNQSVAHSSVTDLERQVGRLEAKLAELYDQYQNSLQPLSPERDVAKRGFKKLLADLHATHAPDVLFDSFRRGTVERCREYLRKNKPV